MTGPSFHILFEFREGPYGGANQFLKALRDALARAGRYAEEPARADVVLFNSHHDLKAVMAARRTFPDKPFIHRVDGPMRLYNGPSDKRDALVIRANNALADATVFQSRWSLQENRRLGWVASGPETVIGNAPDPSIFNLERPVSPMSGDKIRLIATSWSDNPNKGFDAYEHLDSTLDFLRFEMVFIGNTAIRFGNIRHLPPMPSAELAKKLKESDVFIAGSRHDPCSNSLIEALHCGLPAVARNDGGYPEILGLGGELFETPEEIPPLVEKIGGDYTAYLSRIVIPDISEIAAAYLDFARTLLDGQGAGRLTPKRLGTLRALAFRLRERYAAAFR